VSPNICVNCGADPWSAADALVGLFGLDETDLPGKERVQRTRADEGLGFKVRLPHRSPGIKVRR
jgi:hypothetical protein